jgi:DNA-binding response OmpR family regulator
MLYRGGHRLMKKILIVEDESSIAHLILYNLERIGYHATIAGDGVEALRLLDSFSPQLVTLDLLLPQRSGWEVLHCLRHHARKQIALLPVIVVSALNSPQLREDMRRNGVHHCLGKPFSVTELCVLVNSVLDGPAEMAAASPL